MAGVAGQGSTVPDRGAGTMAVGTAACAIIAGTAAWHVVGVVNMRRCRTLSKCTSRARCTVKCHCDRFSDHGGGGVTEGRVVGVAVNASRYSITKRVEVLGMISGSHLFCV